MEVLRVQTIAHKTKDSPIPSIFVRAETEQPGTTTVHGVKLEVPIIYFSNPNEETLQNEIMEAAKEWGMFQIVNHESPNDVIRKLQSVGREFFELPQEEKEVIAKPVGYGTSLQKEVNGKKGWVDHLFHIVWPPSSSVNYRVWPNKPASYRMDSFFSILYFFLIIILILFPSSLGEEIIKSPPLSPTLFPSRDPHPPPTNKVMKSQFLIVGVVCIACLLVCIITTCLNLICCSPAQEEAQTNIEESGHTL